MTKGSEASGPRLAGFSATGNATSFSGPEELEAAKARIVEEFGAWTTPVDLGYGVLSCDVPDPSGGTRLRRIVQVFEDVLARPLNGVRVLDLGCLEGMVAIELARRGASVVGLEARMANLAKARFAAHALGLTEVNFIHDDVRNLSIARCGTFDVVLCLGLLYHLPAPDVFGLADRLHEVATRAVLIDTHVSLSEATRKLLGPLETLDHRGQSYRGRQYHEFEPNSLEADRLKCVWSSIDRRPSFWPTKPSLFNLLEASGFTSVAEVRQPGWNGMPEDRLMAVALKGHPVETITSLGATRIPRTRLPE